jgi:hypothetical protein
LVLPRALNDGPEDKRTARNVLIKEEGANLYDYYN